MSRKWVLAVFAVVLAMSLGLSMVWQTSTVETLPPVPTPNAASQMLTTTGVSDLASLPVDAPVRAASVPHPPRYESSQTATYPWGSPRGLGALVEEPSVENSRVALLPLVEALRACQFASARFAAIERALSATVEPQLKKVHLEKYEDLQRKVAGCQTISTDPVLLQTKLLQLSVKRGKVGAAALLLNVEPSLKDSLIDLIVREAKAGDLVSIAQVISRSPEEAHVTPEVHQMLSVAIYKARSVPNVALKAKQYLDAAASWSNNRVASQGRQSSPLVDSLSKPMAADTESQHVGSGERSEPQRFLDAGAELADTASRRPSDADFAFLVSPACSRR